MTVVMVWRETLANRIWIVSDSRLSHSGGGGGFIRLTDRAAKLLEVPVTLRSSRLPSTTRLSTTLGFAFTGSSLVALQAYAAVLPLWSRLETSGEEKLPTIQQCAEHLAIFVGAYSSEIDFNGDARCQCVLMGYDQSSASVSGWLIEADPQQFGPTPKMRELELARPDYFEAFGSGRLEASAKIASMRSVDQVIRREPLDMIRHWLKDEPLDDVGGAVQIGQVTQAGFELYFDVQHFRVGSSRAGDALVNMTYRGFELSTITRVGEAFVGLRGLS